MALESSHSPLAVIFHKNDAPQRRSKRWTLEQCQTRSQYFRKTMLSVLHFPCRKRWGPHCPAWKSPDIPGNAVKMSVLRRSHSWSDPKPEKHISISGAGNECFSRKKHAELSHLIKIKFSRGRNVTEPVLFLQRQSGLRECKPWRNERNENFQ